MGAHMGKEDITDLSFLSISLLIRLPPSPSRKGIFMDQFLPGNSRGQGRDWNNKSGFEKMNNRKPGDWTCRSCDHLNFSRRDSCQRCSDLRPSGSGGGAGAGGGDRSEYSSFGSRGGSSFGGSDVRPGDWYCSCAAHNFASRSSCFKCGTFKEDSAVAGGGFDAEMTRSRGYGFGSGSSGGRAGWKSGDWICNRSGCNEHNFASRMECFRCSAPREPGTEV